MGQMAYLSASESQRLKDAAKHLQSVNGNDLLRSEGGVVNVVVNGRIFTMLKIESLDEGRRLVSKRSALWRKQKVDEVEQSPAIHDLRQKDVGMTRSTVPGGYDAPDGKDNLFRGEGTGNRQVPNGLRDLAAGKGGRRCGEEGGDDGEDGGQDGQDGWDDGPDSVGTGSTKSPQPQFSLHRTRDFCAGRVVELEGLNSSTHTFAIIIETFPGHSTAISTTQDQGHSSSHKSSSPVSLSGANADKDAEQNSYPEVKVSRLRGSDALKTGYSIDFANTFIIYHTRKLRFVGLVSRSSSDDFWLAVNTVHRDNDAFGSRCKAQDCPCRDELSDSGNAAISSLRGTEKENDMNLTEAFMSRKDAEDSLNEPVQVEDPLRRQEVGETAYERLVLELAEEAARNID